MAGLSGSSWIHRVCVRVRIAHDHCGGATMMILMVLVNGDFTAVSSSSLLFSSLVK